MGTHESPYRHASALPNRLEPILTLVDVITNFVENLFQQVTLDFVEQALDLIGKTLIDPGDDLPRAPGEEKSPLVSPFTSRIVVIPSMINE